MKILLIAGLVLLVLIEYSMCVVSHRADEEAERMYRRWKESKDEREQKISNR